MTDFKAGADRLSANLCQPHWRPSRAHVEQARNLLRQADNEIESLRFELKAKDEELKIADAQIERLQGPHYLQGDGGWYALSVSGQRYCFHADTLEAVKELESRAREMTKTALK